MINIRTKGAGGEREVCDSLNYIINNVYISLQLPPPVKPQVQRNQQQTAVGGCDLIGTYDLAIEVKRQEQLAINTWWQQCVKSAQQCGHHPVLVFRQNAKPGQRTKWRVMTFIEIPGPTAQHAPYKYRAELDYADFLSWFHDLAMFHVQAANPQAVEKWPPPPSLARAA